MPLFMQRIDKYIHILFRDQEENYKNSRVTPQLTQLLERFIFRFGAKQKSIGKSFFFPKLFLN